MKKPLLGLLATALAATLLWVGCSPNRSPEPPAGQRSATPPATDHNTMDHGAMRQATTAATANAEEIRPYPLTTCLVSGEELGGMGEPVRLVYEGQEMKFCCQDCVKDFQTDPDKFLAKLAGQTADASAPPPMKMPADDADHSGHQH